MDLKLTDKMLNERVVLMFNGQPAFKIHKINGQ